MQYVRSITGTVSKSWNSINPATLSGAIDVIVVEQEDGMRHTRAKSSYTTNLVQAPSHARLFTFALANGRSSGPQTRRYGAALGEHMLECLLTNA